MSYYCESCMGEVEGREVKKSFLCTAHRTDITRVEVVCEFCGGKLE